MYTSGTTGRPKGVVVPHSGLTTLERVPTTWLGLGFISCSPFATTSGSLLVCGPLRGGLSGWFLPRFDPDRWIALVERERPVAAFLVPAMVELIVGSPRFGTADLGSLAVVNVGSAPIATATLRRFGAGLPGAEVLCGYGMTEFGAVTAVPLGDGGRHLGSVGLPLPGVEVRIVDAGGAPLPPGAVGRVTIGGTRRARSYLGDDEGTEQTWVDGWLVSGDLGHLDTDGHLWIVGREKEIIIRGGHNVVPGEVEAALFEHPAVAEAVVAGVEHPVLGQDVAAWVVLRHPASADALRSFLLASWPITRCRAALPWSRCFRATRAARSSSPASNPGPSRREGGIHDVDRRGDRACAPPDPQPARPPQPPDAPLHPGAPAGGPGRRGRCRGERHRHPEHGSIILVGIRLHRRGHRSGRLPRHAAIEGDVSAMLALADGWARVWDCALPVIAQVQGNCLAGGTDLALHCDLVVAADDARIGFPPVRSMGVPPTNMWLYHLGPQWTKRLVLTGDTLSGVEARDVGLVVATAPAEALDDVVLGLAQRMALIGRDLLVANKRVVNMGVELMGRSQLQRFAALNDAIGHRAGGEGLLGEDRRGRAARGGPGPGRGIRRCRPPGRAIARRP